MIQDDDEICFDDDDSVINMISSFLSDIQTNQLNSIQIGFLAKLPSSKSQSLERLFLNLRNLIINNKEKNMNTFSLIINTKLFIFIIYNIIYDSVIIDEFCVSIADVLHCINSLQFLKLWLS